MAVVRGATAAALSCLAGGRQRGSGEAIWREMVGETGREGRAAGSGRTLDLIGVGLRGLNGYVQSGFN